MEHAKLANGNTHMSSATPLMKRAAKNRKGAPGANADAPRRNKAGPANSKVGLPPRNKTERKPKAERLVCRYCGSDDLAPSFIKRRDRRCRKCFSKRYGSAARTKKARINK